MGFVEFQCPGPAFPARCLGKQVRGRYSSAACEVALMLSRGTVELVDRDAPQDASFAQAFSARREG